MKRFAHIAIIAVLLVAVTGITVNTHYCHGTARSSTVAVDAEHRSCCGDEMDACPSCQDVVSSNVVHEDISMIPVTDGFALLIPADLPADAGADVHLHADFDFDVLPVSHGPPGLSAGMAIPVSVQSFLN